MVLLGDERFHGFFVSRETIYLVAIFVIRSEPCVKYVSFFHVHNFIFYDFALDCFGLVAIDDSIIATPGQFRA